MNKNFFTRISIALVCLLLSLTTSQAQQPKGTINFSCVVWKNLSVPEVYYRLGKEFIPLQLSPGNRSELYPLKGSATLELYNLIEVTKGGDTKKEYKLVGKSAIPTGVSRMLFFITETDEPKQLPLRLSGIDDSLLTFPRGASRFVNFTKVPLAVTFAEKTSVIKPKGMTLIRSNVTADGGLLPFFVRDSKGTNLYENRLFTQQIGRDMIFILPPTRPGGRVIVKLLPQLIAFPNKVPNSQR